MMLLARTLQRLFVPPPTKKEKREDEDENEEKDDVPSPLLPMNNSGINTTVATTREERGKKLSSSSSSNSTRDDGKQATIRGTGEDFEGGESRKQSRSGGGHRRERSTATTRSSLGSLFSSALSFRVNSSSFPRKIMKLDEREVQIYAILSDHIRAVSLSGSGDPDRRAKLDLLLKSYESSILTAGASTNKRNLPSRNAMLSKRGEVITALTPPPSLTWFTLHPITNEINCVDPGGQVFLSSVKPAHNLELLDR